MFDDVRNRRLVYMSPTISVSDNYKTKLESREEMTGNPNQWKQAEKEARDTWRW